MSAHTATHLSPIELELIEAGEAMDFCIARTKDAELYGPYDEEYLACLALEIAAKNRFAKAHRAAVRERRLESAR